MSKGKEFIDKLQGLLKEYNADISWGCGDGSDTYGIYDEEMSIEVEGKEVLCVDGNCIDASSLDPPKPCKNCGSFDHIFCTRSKEI